LEPILWRILIEKERLTRFNVMTIFRLARKIFNLNDLRARTVFPRPQNLEIEGLIGKILGNKDLLLASNYGSPTYPRFIDFKDLPAMQQRYGGAKSWIPIT
jgi:hypothetical protein